MRNYELTIILPGAVSAAKKKAANEKIEKLVKEGKGKVTKTEEWGLRDLAYKIGKETSGNYTYYDLELDGKTAKNLGEKLSLDEGFTRYLLILKN